MAARKQRLVHHSTVIQLPSKERALRVVVVADTHSSPHSNTRRVIQELRPDAILHGGDIGDLKVLTELAKLAPLTTVRGNIDEHSSELPDSVDITIKNGERSLLKIFLTHIAVYGAKLRAEAARLAVQHQARMVICGHSHVPFIGRDRGLVLFNPGSIGPRRGSLPITMGLLEVSSTTIGLKHISCETGEVWLP